MTKEEHIAKTIPKDISVWVTMFLRFKNMTISSRLPREKVSRDSGYGFEILYEYLLRVTQELRNGFCKSAKGREFFKNWCFVCIMNVLKGYTLSDKICYQQVSFLNIQLHPRVYQKVS